MTLDRFRVDAATAAKMGLASVTCGTAARYHSRQLDFADERVQCAPGGVCPLEEWRSVSGESGDKEGPHDELGVSRTPVWPLLLSCIAFTFAYFFGSRDNDVGKYLGTYILAALWL
jgi:hypothetical protein